MYYRLLPEIKNALQAGKEKTTFPFSRMDLSVLKVLVEKGYLKSVEEEVAGKKSVLVVRFGGKRNSGTTMDFKVFSKPSRRFYADYRNLHRVRQGYGLGVLSTSQGILSDMDAKKKKVGGEYLFQIW